MNVKSKIILSVLITAIISSLTFGAIIGGINNHHESTVGELLESNSRAQITVSNIKDAIGRIIRIESERYRQAIDTIRNLSEQSEKYNRELEQAISQLGDYKQREAKGLQSSIKKLRTIENRLRELGDYIESFKK